jgi:hypothetical protein
VNALAQFIGQFALLFDRTENRGTALIESTQTDQLVGDDPDLFVVQRAGHFLTIPCNEGNGIAVIQEIYDGGYLGRFDIHLGSELFSVSHEGDFIMRKLIDPSVQKHKEKILIPFSKSAFEQNTYFSRLSRN